MKYEKCVNSNLYPFLFVCLFAETGSEDDGLADLSDDDFFVSGTSSDEADADDELTDISARWPISPLPPLPLDASVFISNYIEDAE